MDEDQKKLLIAQLATQIFISMQQARPNPAFGMTLNEADRAVYMARRIVQKAWDMGNQEDVRIKPVTENLPSSGSQL